MLSEEQREHYNKRGYVFPFKALSPSEAKEARRKLEDVEAKVGAEAYTFLNYKAHLPFKFLTDIIRHPRILDAVEDLIGPNILCWGGGFFQKNAHDGKFISWHQDSYYYGIDPPNTVTAWLAFSPSNKLSGSVKVIPGSQFEQRDWVETPSEKNILMRGQTILNVDESQAVYMNLEPGEFSLHHESIVHASDPNESDDRRIGYSIHYIAPSARQIKYITPGSKPVAALVRGKDEYGYWEHEELTDKEFDSEMLANLGRMKQQFFARRK
jgi:non-heme Fe2+,alpha-ketoglutarate-dependent halogenase